MSMVKPESEVEMDQYMNTLSADIWKSVLTAYQWGGDTNVVKYLRNRTGAMLVDWTDDQLLEYFSQRDLQVDYFSVENRP